MSTQFTQWLYKHNSSTNSSSRFRLPTAAQLIDKDGLTVLQQDILTLANYRDSNTSKSTLSILNNELNPHPHCCNIHCTTIHNNLNPLLIESICNSFINTSTDITLTNSCLDQLFILELSQLILQARFKSNNSSGSVSATIIDQFNLNSFDPNNSINNDSNSTVRTVSASASSASSAKAVEVNHPHSVESFNNSNNNNKKYSNARSCLLDSILTLIELLPVLQNRLQYYTNRELLLTQQNEQQEEEILQLKLKLDNQIKSQSESDLLLITTHQQELSLLKSRILTLESELIQSKSTINLLENQLSLVQQSVADQLTADNSHLEAAKTTIKSLKQTIKQQKKVTANTDPEPVPDPIVRSRSKPSSATSGKESIGEEKTVPVESQLTPESLLSLAIAIPNSELQIITPKPHSGYGLCVYGPNEFYLGYFENYQRSGTGVYIWADGRKYSGNWLLDRKCGYGIYNWPDGDQYTGHYLNDEMSGFGIYKFTDNTVFTGQWRNDQSNGNGKFEYSDGAIYTGEFNKDNKHGPGIMKLPTGQRFKEVWKNGIRISSVIITETNNSLLTATPPPARTTISRPNIPLRPGIINAAKLNSTRLPLLNNNTSKSIPTTPNSIGSISSNKSGSRTVR